MKTPSSPEAITKEFQSALRHTLVYGLGSIAIKALGFLMLPFYTHYLTPRDYGTLEILDLSMSLLGMFLNIGITAALLRQYAAANSERERQATISTALIFTLTLGVATFAVGAGLARPAATLILGPGASETPVLLSLASLVLGFVGNPCRAYLRALGASTGFVLVDTLGVLGMLALNIAFIAILKMGLLGILLSSALVSGAQAIALAAWTLRRTGIGFSTTLLRRMVQFGAPLILSNLAVFALNFSDRFFLQHMQSLEMVGIYAVGYKFAFMLNYLIVQPFSAMWEPQRYTVHKQENHRTVFDQMFMLYALALSYGALILAALSPELVRVMAGPKFEASKDVIPVVALAYVFWGLGYYAQNGMLLANKPMAIGVVSLGAVAANLTLNYFLVLRYGFMGAAWATALSFVGIAAASYICSERVLPLGLSIRRASLLILTAAAFYAACAQFQPGNLAIAIAFKCGMLALYPALVWKARILSAGEMATLLSAKDNLLARLTTWRKGYRLQSVA